MQSEHGKMGIWYVMNDNPYPSEGHVEEMRQVFARRERWERHSMESQVIVALESSFFQLMGLRGWQVFMGTYTEETKTKEIVRVKKKKFRECSSLVYVQHRDFVSVLGSRL